MDNEFENIVPWNGANDNGKDVRLKWKRNFEKIAKNFEELVDGGAGGGAFLTEDVLSNANKTGHIENGQKLQKGMTLTQVVKALLFKPVLPTLAGKLSTGNEVEYGTAKGKLTYTATRNGSGEMTKAFLENDEKNVLEFSTVVNGVQTAVRTLSGTYTEAESYKATVVYAESEDGTIPETILNNTVSVNVRRKWFAGVADTIPTTSAQVRALKYSGFYTGAGNYIFDATDWKLLAICFPEGANLSRVKIEGYLADLIPGDGTLKMADSVLVNGANGSLAKKYNVWYVKAAIVNDVTNNGTIIIS
ncbi:hypothetical protein DW932_18060 [Bacteroides intestinalis]|jgi:hypothetical protein|uniref:hypothetical protein n=1 Tax=Bacteroides TaxID=816 RepID=UPI000E50CB5E|nr:MULTISPECIES: hypothetical protein [Bacteroides]RHA57617.1 hypothetical protein DW932_18060 [Bacteroides intestinalis]DAJ80776.1 MAG TPA: hypothetical protein [Caudoviricetes sp.]